MYVGLSVIILDYVYFNLSFLFEVGYVQNNNILNMRIGLKKLRIRLKYGRQKVKLPETVKLSLLLTFSDNVSKKIMKV